MMIWADITFENTGRKIKTGNVNLRMGVAVILIKMGGGVLNECKRVILGWPGKNKSKKCGFIW